MNGALWIFGYGSLVWRPEFDHVEGQPACVRGWARRFWQGSTDHRGVPGAPGRVVTLVPEAQAVTWGMAYRVADDRRDAVLTALDHREKGGYERVETALFFRGEARPPVDGILYHATPENPNYLGPAPLEAIASQVRTSRGPSGSNPEYVLRLAAFLRDLDVQDPHVFALEALLR